MIATLKSEGKELREPFTISSSPTEREHLEITKKLTGRPFSNALASLKEGDNVFIEAPFGDFTFKGEYDRVAMLAGGIGITPLRCMIRYATDEKLDTKITLIYSNRFEDEIVFKNELDEMRKQNRNLKVVYTITRPGEKWNGYRGRIDKKMIQKEIPDYMECVFYICGPLKMVEDMVAILKEMNIPDRQIKQEYFPGY